MNKKIKLTIASALTICAFSTIYPGELSLINTKAYAVSYSLADKGELESLDIQTTNGDELQLCDDYDGESRPLTDQKTYYITMDDKSDGIKIASSVAGDGYIAKVFESDGDNATGHDLGENMSIENGTTTLYIRTYTSEDSYKRAKDHEEVTNCSKTYKINVKKVSTNPKDNIHLEDIELDGGNIPINFNREVYSYNIAVSEDDYDITVRVRPEEDEYTVKIGGFEVTEDDKYRKTLSLNKGTTEIKINITDEDDKNRNYILNVTRGGTSSNTTSSSTIGTNNTSENAIYNQWVKVNNMWQYMDSTGTPLKNTWLNNNSNDYYLKEDGFMATGWLNNNGHWYYLDTNGVMKTGWQYINGTWYYFDTNGIMQTGWIKDMTGKWYYLQESGVMAKNVTINGYKLGSDGVWIK